MTITIDLALMIVLCTAVVEALKSLKIKTEILPFLSILVGIGFSFLVGETEGWKQLVFQGTIVGLAGAGLFDFAKLSLRSGAKTVAGMAFGVFGKKIK